MSHTLDYVESQLEKSRSYLSKIPDNYRKSIATYLLLEKINKDKINNFIHDLLTDENLYNRTLIYAIKKYPFPDILTSEELKEFKETYHDPEKWIPVIENDELAYYKNIEDGVTLTPNNYMAIFVDGKFGGSRRRRRRTAHRKRKSHRNSKRVRHTRIKHTRRHRHRR
jgi:hypothetical protein